MHTETGQQIERLTKEALGQTVLIEDREYSTVPLHDPRTSDPSPPVLEFRTLQSFAEHASSIFIQDYVHERGAFAHVESPTRVALRTGIFGEFNQRTEISVAVYEPLRGFRFGDWYDPETFNIALQTHFLKDDDLSKIQSLVGNLQSEQVQTVDDDGVTQQATARVGIAKRATAVVPNPVLLTPYRTFAEVPQPSSLFVLRLRGGSATAHPECALFEADGGAWKLDAIENIKGWLKSDLGDTVDLDIPVYG